MGFRTIVKHSYVPAGRDALARMKAHVRYIKHRPGHDLEEKERSFFNGRKGQISKSIVMGALENVSKSDPVVAHKLILSPGVPDVDIETYVRSVMRDISRSKGQELTWFAVKHENTAHAHAHVVVMPRDQLGHRVRFTKTDYQTIKKAGDAYADRTKPLEKEKSERKSKEDKSSVTGFFSNLKEAIKLACQRMRAVLTSSPDSGSNNRSYARKNDDALIGQAPALWQLKIKNELRAERNKAKDWKKFAQPIFIREEGREGFKPGAVEYSPRTPLQELRRLEKRYLARTDGVADQMTEEDYIRLKEWIKSQFKEAKLLERKAKGVTEITVEISSEETLEANAKSSPLTLKNLKMRHLKGELHLSDHEYKALSDWLNKSSGGKRDK